MEWNNEASEALMGVFENPLILNRILEQLPNSQLLQLSFVNKLWKKEARIVMKKRGSVMALLKSDGVRGCGEILEAFAANLETFNEDLYSGMTIWLRPVVLCSRTGSLEVEAIHESILAGMRGKLKRLSIRLDYPGPEVCWDGRDCPNFLLLALLLRDLIMDLEHLTLKIDGLMELFVHQFLPCGPYPKLKVLKLNDVNGILNEWTFGNHTRLLISRDPNLQEIHTCGSVSLEENLVEGREGVVHVHESIVHDPVQDISENAIPALRLKQIYFWYTIEPEFGLDRFNEKAQSLLRTCCSTTLERLGLDEVGAVLFMSYGIPLVNVKELEIGLDYVELEQFEPQILSILSRFDFTCLFPNLKKVVIRMPLGYTNIDELSRDTMDAVAEYANAGRVEPTLPRAENIKYLGLFQESISVAAVQFFARMFPDVEELDIGAADEVIPVESCWELWPELKLIMVDGELYQPQ